MIYTWKHRCSNIYYTIFNPAVTIYNIMMNKYYILCIILYDTFHDFGWNKNSHWEITKKSIDYNRFLYFILKLYTAHWILYNYHNTSEGRWWCPKAYERKENRRWKDNGRASTAWNGREKSASQAISGRKWETMDLNV